MSKNNKHRAGATGRCEKCELDFIIKNTSQFAAATNALRLADREVPRSFEKIVLRGCSTCSPEGGWEIITIT